MSRKYNPGGGLNAFWVLEQTAAREHEDYLAAREEDMQLNTIADEVRFEARMQLLLQYKDDPEMLELAKLAIQNL